MHYGFFAIPEQGAHVLVGCIDGDPRRRFWFGCVPEHQETHTLFHGRYKWEGGPDGPLSSTGNEIEPIYTNWDKAFKSEKDSSEWKTRGADYQATAVDKDEAQVPNPDKAKYLDQQFGDISKDEKDSWVKPIVGAHGYDWTGFKSLGAFKSPRVYGMSTPGFHSFAMDDRAFNNRMRLRSATGHQIILDDTNERIYLMTNKGDSWIEMDSSGNIDVYAKRRLSFHAEKDINFTTEETFRVKAQKGIHLYAGKTQSQPDLDSEPEEGEIRMHAKKDIHVISEQNIRVLSVEDTLVEVGGKSCISVGESLFLQVQDDIHIKTNTGDYNVTVSGNLNEIVQGDVNKLALGTMKNMSNGNAQMHSFRGKMDVGAQKSLNVKSIAEDVTFEAMGKNNSGTGGVYSKSPESQSGVTSSGIFAATNKSIRQKAAEKFEQEIKETEQAPPSEAPPPSGPCDLGSGPLSTTGYSGADLAARLAYNAGFRGADLVTATAIAGAESSYNQSAQNNGDGRPQKWGPSVGMWQVRTLQQPSQWTGLDNRRDPNIVGGPGNAQNNADFAYDVYQRSGFREWGAFTNGSYKNHLSAATTAVNSMCEGMMAAPAPAQDTQEFFEQIFGSSNYGDPGMSLEELCSPLNGSSGNTLFSMDGSGMNLQAAISDIAFKHAGNVFSTDMFSSIIPKIDETSWRLTQDMFATLSFMVEAIVSPEAAAAAYVAQALIQLAGSLEDILSMSHPDFSILAGMLGVGPLLNLNLDFLLDELCNAAIPPFDSNIEAVFQIEGHDTNTFGDPFESIPVR